MPVALPSCFGICKSTSKRLPDRSNTGSVHAGSQFFVAGTVWWLEEETTVTLSPQPGTREPWTLVLTQLSPLHEVEDLSPKNGIAHISRGFSHLPWLGLDISHRHVQRSPDPIKLILIIKISMSKAWYWPSGFQSVILAGDDRGGRHETGELTSQLKRVCFSSA